MQNNDTFAGLYVYSVHGKLLCIGIGTAGTGRCT